MQGASSAGGEGLSARAERVRSLFDAYARRDLRALLDAAHLELEVHPGVLGGLEGTVYRGRAGYRQFIEAVDAFWDDFRIEPHEIREYGDTILVLGRAVARGRDGIVVEADVGYVLVMLDGKVRRFESFANARDAVEAVRRTTGLSRPDV